VEARSQLQKNVPRFEVELLMQCASGDDDLVRVVNCLRSTSAICVMSG
jgi:hypothetical protein